MNEMFNMKTQLRVRGGAHTHTHTHTLLPRCYARPLQLNEMSMREEISEQPLRFELTDRKKTKYLFQATSKEEKEEWVSDLRDLFLEQMLALKGPSRVTYTNARARMLTRCHKVQCSSPASYSRASRAELHLHGIKGQWSGPGTHLWLQCPHSRTTEANDPELPSAFACQWVCTEETQLGCHQHASLHPPHLRAQ